MPKSLESISKGLNISIKRPILLVPFIAPVVVQWVFSMLAQLFPIRYYFIEEPNTLILMFGSFIAAILGFIAACMLIDMVNDVLNNQSISLSKSLNFVVSRISTLIVTAIVAALLSITVILLPIAIFIVVIAIIETVDVIESIKRAFTFVSKNLSEVIVFIVLVIVIGMAFSYGFSLIPIVGPYVGTLVSWLLYSVL
ncbi:MAG: hypothetical protein QXD12_04210 [Candidatus Nezhaarchaeales archaeon]